MNRTVRNLIYFSSAVVLVKLIGAITSFAIARILSPSDYGVWLTMMLIISYSTIACLGTVETLLKNYPNYAGMGNETGAKNLEDGVFSSLLLSGAILLIGGLTFNFFVDSKSFESMLFLIRLMLITAVIAFFSAFYYYRFMARQNFKMISFVETARSILTFIFIVVFSWLWGIKGTVVGFFLCEMTVFIVSALLSKSMYGKVGFNFNLRLIWDLIKVGFPISIVWWIFILQTSADRVISMSMLGKAATGYYGLGVSIISALILIPQTVGRVLYPRINEEIGKDSNQKKLSLLVITPAHTISLLLPILIGVLILTAPAIYYYVFPKYLRGLHSAQILLLGVFFVSLIRNGVNFLVALNKQNEVLSFALFSLAVNAAVNITLIRLGFDIEGLAVGTAASGALLTTLVWRSVFKNMGYDRVGQLKEIFNLYLPFILLLALLSAFAIVDPSLLSEAGAHTVYYTLVFIALFSLMLFSVPVLSCRSRELYNLIRINASLKS